MSEHDFITPREIRTPENKLSVAILAPLNHEISATFVNRSIQRGIMELNFYASDFFRQVNMNDPLS